jgi:hypothetical protein
VGGDGDRLRLGEPEELLAFEEVRDLTFPIQQFELILGRMSATQSPFANNRSLAGRDRIFMTR